MATGTEQHDQHPASRMRLRKHQHTFPRAPKPVASLTDSTAALPARFTWPRRPSPSASAFLALFLALLVAFFAVVFFFGVVFLFTLVEAALGLAEVARGFDVLALALLLGLGVVVVVVAVEEVLLFAARGRSVRVEPPRGVEDAAILAGVRGLGRGLRLYCVKS